MALKLSNPPLVGAVGLGAPLEEVGVVTVPETVVGGANVGGRGRPFTCPGKGAPGGAIIGGMPGTGI